MRNRKLHTFSLLLASAIIIPLAACQSTSETGYHADREKSIEAVLARAAEDAATQGNVTETLSLLERVYRQDSSNPENALKYAAALRDAERYNRAEMVLKPFVQNTNDAAILTEYAAIQSAMGNYGSAEDYARQAIEIAPTSAQAHQILGIVLDAQGRHPQAETAFRKALDHWIGNPAPALNNLGLNLAAQGYIDEALDTLRKAAEISPQRQEIERNIRIVSALQGPTARQRPNPAPMPNPKPEPEAGTRSP